MAPKSTAHNVAVISVRFAEVQWSPDLNFCREKATSKGDTLEASLAGGWNQMLGVIPAQQIEEASTKMQRDFVKEALDYRQRKWDEFKEDKSPEGALKLQVFVDLYVESGKLIKPRWLANACYQRGEHFFAAMVLRRKQPEKDEKTGLPLPGAMDMVDTVPVAPRSYADDSARLIEQVLENEHKSLGAEPLSFRDRLRTGKKFFQLGKPQTFFRKLYTDTTGQKLFYILRLNVLWPNLHILDRMLKDEKEEDYIPYGPLGVKELAALLRRSQRSTLGTGEKLITEEELAGIFGNVRKGMSNKPAIMKRDVIEGLTQNCPVHVIQDVAKAVLANNTDAYAKWIPLEIGINALEELAAMGEYPEAEKYLVEKLNATRAARGVTAVKQSA